MITIEVSPGELIDKLTILQIRLEHVGDEAKRAAFEAEFDQLAAAAAALPASPEMEGLRGELLAINRQLWAIEDDIRDCERNGDFGAKFIDLARSVYKTNDKRSAVKSRINRALQSNFLEEKSYAPY